MANCTAAKQFGFAVIFLILIHWGCCKNGNCDVSHCKSLFPTVFKDFFKRGTHLLCRSTDETIDCVNKCLQIFFPDFDLNSKAFITSEVCSYDIAYDLNRHWNCIGGHFHRLLTCLSISGSMTPINSSNQTLKQLSCKKFVEALDCPYKILQDCEEEAIEIVSKLFSNVFKASMKSTCHRIPINALFDLPVTYSLNNSYLNTAACLDSLPNVAGNCFTQYLQNFDVNELYHCRNTCERLADEACLPSSLMSDFYIPLLSFGKYSCAEDSAVQNTMQMQEPFTVAYNSGLASEVNSEDSTINPRDDNDYFFPSDEAKRNDVLSSNYITLDHSTLNYRLNTKEVDHDEVLSTIHSPNSNISLIPTKKHPEIGSISSDYSATTPIENNDALKLVSYLHYTVVNFIAALVLI